MKFHSLYSIIVFNELITSYCTKLIKRLGIFRIVNKKRHVYAISWGLYTFELFWKYLRDDADPQCLVISYRRSLCLLKMSPKDGARG